MKKPGKESPTESLSDFENADFERFMTATQRTIQNLLHTANRSQDDLAKLLDVSKQRVSQMFHGRGRNLTMRTVWRIFASAGEAPLIVQRSDYEKLAGIIRGQAETIAALRKCLPADNSPESEPRIANAE